MTNTPIPSYNPIPPIPSNPCKRLALQWNPTKFGAATRVCHIFGEKGLLQTSKPSIAMAFPWPMAIIPARRLITEEGDRAVRQGLAVLLRGNGEAEFDLSAEGHGNPKCLKILMIIYS